MCSNSTMPVNPYRSCTSGLIDLAQINRMFQHMPSQLINKIINCDQVVNWSYKIFGIAQHIFIKIPCGLIGNKLHKTFSFQPFFHTQKIISRLINISVERSSLKDNLCIFTKLKHICWHSIGTFNKSLVHYVEFCFVLRIEFFDKFF